MRKNFTTLSSSFGVGAYIHAHFLFFFIRMFSHSITTLVVNVVLKTVSVTNNDVCFFSNVVQAVPPLEVTDLIEEVRDGHVFLSLLEVLLGTTLVSLVVPMFRYAMNVHNSWLKKTLPR